MSDGVHDLLVRGIAASKADEKTEARKYLEWALRLDPTCEQSIQAWYWLSEISDDPSEKRYYLEMILIADQNYQPARRSLAILEGRLHPEEVVNPDHLPAPQVQGQQEANAWRIVCPQCGGRLTYTPDGRSLWCEFCEARQSPAGHLQAGGSQSQINSRQINIADSAPINEAEKFTISLSSQLSPRTCTVGVPQRCSGWRSVSFWQVGQ